MSSVAAYHYAIRDVNDVTSQLLRNLYLYSQTYDVICTMNLFAYKYMYTSLYLFIYKYKYKYMPILLPKGFAITVNFVFSNITLALIYYFGKHTRTRTRTRTHELKYYLQCVRPHNKGAWHRYARAVRAYEYTVLPCVYHHTYPRRYVCIYR